jgi:hypothetical protein
MLLQFCKEGLCLGFCPGRPMACYGAGVGVDDAVCAAMPAPSCNGCSLQEALAAPCSLFLGVSGKVAHHIVACCIFNA